MKDALMQVFNWTGKWELIAALLGIGFYLYLSRTWPIFSNLLQLWPLKRAHIVANKWGMC